MEGQYHLDRRDLGREELYNTNSQENLGVKG